MFNHIGTNPDEEAARRGASSLLLTLLGLGGVTGFAVGLAAFTAAEVLLEAVEEVEEMVEVVVLDAEEVGPPPAAPPPPPPPAAAAAPETEEAPDEPEEAPEEVEELPEEVPEETRDHAGPPGQEGGRLGGDPDGVAGGTLGGDPDGTGTGPLTSGLRVFHHSELVVEHRADVVYPRAARGLGLAAQRCVARVFIDERGRPYDVIVDVCPAAFHATTKAALLKWRWAPPRAEGQRVKAQTTLGITYTLK